MLEVNPETQRDRKIKQYGHINKKYWFQGKKLELHNDPRNGGIYTEETEKYFECEVQGINI